MPRTANSVCCAFMGLSPACANCNRVAKSCELEQRMLHGVGELYRDSMMPALSIFRLGYLAVFALVTLKRGRSQFLGFLNRHSGTEAVRTVTRSGAHARSRPSARQLNRQPHGGPCRECRTRLPRGVQTAASAPPATQ